MNSIKYQKILNSGKSPGKNKQEDQGSQLRQNDLEYLSHQFRELFAPWRQEIFAAAVLQNDIHCKTVHRKYVENQNEERKEYPD